MATVTRHKILAFGDVEGNWVNDPILIKDVGLNFYGGRCHGRIMREMLVSKTSFPTLSDLDNEKRR